MIAGAIAPAPPERTRLDGTLKLRVDPSR